MHEFFGGIANTEKGYLPLPKEAVFVKEDRFFRFEPEGWNALLWYDPKQDVYFIRPKDKGHITLASGQPLGRRDYALPPGTRFKVHKTEQTFELV